MSMFPWFEVQTRIGLDGWENCWTIDGAPARYDSRQEAEAAIDAFLAEIEEAAAAGFIEETYERDDYRVAEVFEPTDSTADGAGNTSSERDVCVEVFDWRGVSVEMRFERDWLNSGFLSHLEVESISPPRTRLSVTETGYRSHFLSANEIDAYGGPLAYTKAWLDAEANTPAWRAYEDESRQFSLF